MLYYILEDSLGFILNRTNTKLKNRLHKEFKDYGVTPEQWSLLNCVSIDKPITPKEISDIIYKDKPNTNRILEKLFEKKLIYKVPHPTDRRSFHVFLTDEGLKLRTTLVPIAYSITEKLTDGLSPEKVQELKDLLNLLYNNADF